MAAAHTHAHAAHAKKRSRPRPGLSAANWYMKAYASTIGSATPTINSGWPPTTACITPVMAHAASTARAGSGAEWSRASA